MINKQRLIRLTQQLIRINSENPTGNEYEIARFVQNYLKRLGLKPKIYEFAKKRSNVIAVLKGRNTNHTLLITPHLDTVPQGKNWHYKPFAAQIKNGKIYGLGATDCKSNLAVSMEVINSLIEEKNILDYNLLFAATADEESGSNLGLAILLDKGILKPDAALVLDADDFNIIVAQKGLIHLKVKIAGKRAHGAYPWLGKNAIDTSIEVVKKIKAYQFLRKVHKYLKPPTINVGTIKGGDKVNIVADWCEFELDFRFLPGDKAEDILRDIKRIIKKITPNFKIEIEGIQKPFVIENSHPLVKNLFLAIRKLKIKAKLCGSEGATTISFFQDKNITCVASGFGSSGCAHSPDEYVKIDNLYKGALVLEGFLKNYKKEF